MLQSSLFCILAGISLSAQEGFIQDFSTPDHFEAWSTSRPDAYVLRMEGEALGILCDKQQWEGVGLSFPVLDFSSQPYVSLDIQLSEGCAVMCWLRDEEGHQIPVSHYLPAADTLTRLVFDFTGMFATYRWDQLYLGDVNHRQIVTLLFNFNPGGPYQGEVIIDNLAVGSYSDTPGGTSGTGSYLDTVQIIIQPDSMAVLDQDPLGDEDVHGDFMEDNGYVHSGIQLHYRGASNLLSFIQAGRKERNWKVKVAKQDMYRSRREWNFNFCQAVQQEMSYHLFRQAGVPCISNRMVNLVVNGERHGLYLEYEDPDNKPWLLEIFGDEEGDLYKAALDIPDQPSYFAELIYLGPNSSDYFHHYRKKTNHKVAPDDYSSIRDFIIRLNYTPNEQFIDTLDHYFATGPFLDYLVVSNFISNWDGYPHRPKNYWLYQHRGEDGRFYFIPWDLDNTLGLQTHDWNHMGVEADLFYQFFETIWAGHNSAEQPERPLVRRMMKFAQYRNGYIKRYKRFSETLFQEEKLFRELDSLGQRIWQGSGNYDYQMYHNSVASTKAFFHERLRYVCSVLDTLSYVDTVAVTDYVPPYPEINAVEQKQAFHAHVSGPYPNPAISFSRLEVCPSEAMQLRVSLWDLQGRQVMSLFQGYAEARPYPFFIESGSLPPGIYIIQVQAAAKIISRKLVVL